MKKFTSYLKVIALISLYMILPSCSKDESPVITSDEEVYSVKFSIETFDETKTRKTSNNDSDIKHLYYTIYNADTKNIIYSNETPYNSEDNTISVKLPKGNYLIGVVASDKPISFYNNMDQKYQESELRVKYTANTNTDVLSGKNEFTIDSENIIQQIILKRNISKIRLGMNDFDQISNEILYLVPVFIDDQNKVIGADGINILNGKSIFNTLFSKDANEISNLFTFIDRSQFSRANPNNPITLFIPQTTDIEAMESPAGKYIPKVSLYLLGLTKKEELSFPFLGALNPNIPYKRIITKDVDFDAGTITTITGNLFRHEGFNLAVNKIWNETVNEEF